MSGRRLVTIFLAVIGVLAVVLVYTQYYAYYDRVSGVDTLGDHGADIAVSDYQGLNATSSPLKLRGCFTADPAAFAQIPPPATATPLTPPPWFRCFDAKALTEDLAAGRAAAHLLSTDRPEGFDVLAAIYPDGRGYLWSQLNARYTD